MEVREVVLSTVYPTVLFRQYPTVLFRQEFWNIRQYSGFYKHSVEAALSGADKLFQGPALTLDFVKRVAN